MSHDELRELALASPRPGPWQVFHHGKGNFDILDAEGYSVIDGYELADYQFIAAANPQKVLELLDEIANLRKVLTQCAANGLCNRKAP